MNEPRPARSSTRPPDSWSIVANCWYRRTGSSVLSTVTALPTVIRDVWARAAAITVAGAEMAYSDRWCSPKPT